MKIKTNLHDFAMVCYRKFHEFLLLLQDVDEFTFSVVSVIMRTLLFNFIFS